MAYNFYCDEILIRSMAYPEQVAQDDILSIWKCQEN